MRSPNRFRGVRIHRAQKCVPDELTAPIEFGVEHIVIVVLAAVECAPGQGVLHRLRLGANVE